MRVAKVPSLLVPAQISARSLAQENLRSSIVETSRKLLHLALRNASAKWNSRHRHALGSRPMCAAKVPSHLVFR
jgi:hypothetical protein